MSEHTPTPWKFSPWHIEEGSPAVRAPAGHIVCTTASDDDAKFIARAANNHAPLVKALEECRRVLSMMIHPESIKATTSQFAWAQAVETEASARSAIIAAKSDASPPVEQAKTEVEG